MIEVEAALTVCASAEEVAAAYSASPLYVAVTLCGDVLPVNAKLAVAEPLLRPAVASVMFPEVNVTVPVGAPAVPETVAVNDTDCPVTDGLGALPIVTVGDGFCTDWFRAAEFEEVKWASPPYDAVIEWVPTDSAAVLNVAIPPLNVPWPKAVAPSANVTMPVAGPEPLWGVTVAVKIMLW
jgi:hypothetical protein